MGESTDFFEDLRERDTAKAQASSPAEEATAFEPEPEPASAPPAPDLEAPLLEDHRHQEHYQGIQEQEPPPPPPPVLERAPPEESDPLMYVFRVLSTVTVVGALMCLALNVIALVRSFDYRGFDYRVSVFVGIMRCYTVAIAVLVILAETEWQALFRWWRILEFWVGRGLLQVLVAVLTRVLKKLSKETSTLGLLHEIASWWLFVCGLLYVGAGLLCLGRIKHSHMKKENWRRQARKDLEELHKRRAHLEGQLAKH